MSFLRRSACPRSFLIALAVTALGFRPVAAQQTEALDSLLKDALNTFGVPGLAVAIVRNDEVFYLKGAGVRKINTVDPVTADTIFPIASVTKAFTATAIGLLIDEGKADWDDPVRKHLRWFRLADPLADRDVTLRDLLCHRTGLPRHDLLWHRVPWSVEESVRRMAFLEPSRSFRSAFQYNNLGYLAAGLAAASAAGTGWHDLVKTRLLDRLDMKHTVFTSSDAQNNPDHATPHHRRKKQIEAIQWYPDDRQIRGSGSIKSSARDMTHWLRMQLGNGVYDGKRIISPRVLAETHRPQIVVLVEADRARVAGTTLSSYGLGWHISDYRGQPLVEHGGAADGFRARIMLLPRARIGLILFTNIDEAVVLEALGNDLADNLLELPKKDWIAHKRKRRPASSTPALPARVANTRPSHDLTAYTGRYNDPAYGTLRVRLEDNKLRLAWSSFGTDLEHYHFDTFVITSPGRLHDELATFSLEPSGEVGSVRFVERTFKRVVEP